MKKVDWEYPRDGDIILTDNFFIFYVIGYDHPKDRVISYLKYIPNDLKHFFKLELIPHKWLFMNHSYLRPKMLYSPENFKSIEDTFKKNFPEYLYNSKNLGKSVFAIPKDKIKQVFIPQDGLKTLMGLKNKDPLQSIAIRLINLFSNYSKIPLSDLGIHGSILTSMHSQASDIDIAVYGGDNFRILKKTVLRLSDEKKIEYLYEIDTDHLRLNKGIFEDKKFVFNAIRKFSEIHNTYELFEYKQIKPIHFQCKITNNFQAVFRPAIYKIDNYIALDDNSHLKEELVPCEIAAMIGEYRDVVQNEQIALASGMLEMVRNIKTGKIHYRVVVGSGVGEEFILPPDEL